METVTIEGVSLRLAHPDELSVEWVGGEDLMEQLLAAWTVVEPRDLPMNPRLIGRPGVGKTTLAYAAGRKLGRPVYIFQATMDTRPEDLLVTPVVGPNQQIIYVASAVVTAMLKGGVCILDEGNRMSEKSWAGLAPLLDNRRYVESLVAGVKIKAHPDFRFVATMNQDTSTFDLPEYIQSRLQPQIEVPFPSREEERRILQYNVPFTPERMLEFTADFLARAHAADEPFTARDGVNILRYAAKLLTKSKADKPDDGRIRETLERSIGQIVGKPAVRYLDAKTSGPGPRKRKGQKLDFLVEDPPEEV
jgi:Cdc6-like AAA superfamily ATPase